MALMVDRVPIPEIRRSLWSLGLILPSKSDFLGYESELMAQAPASLHPYFCNPLKTKKTKSRVKPLFRLIIDLKLGAYFNVKYPFDKLLRIFKGGEIRGTIEGLLLTTITPEEIVTLVNHRYGHNLTKEDLIQYKLLFFDTRHMRPEDWEYHLRKSDSRDSAIKTFSLVNPDEHDRAKWLCGLPVQIDYTDMLQKVMHDSFFHLDQALSAAMPDLVAARTLTAMLVQVGDRLKKWGGDRDQGAIEVAIKIITENRGSDLVPIRARIHEGPLPVIDITPNKVSTATPGQILTLPVSKPEED